MKKTDTADTANIEEKEQQNQNVFNVVKDLDFVHELLGDVTAINLSEQERQKLALYLRYDSSSLSLFNSINGIYNIIGANFNNPGKFLVIPFVRDGKEHINIQKIS